MITIPNLAQFRSMHAWRHLRTYLEEGGDLRGVRRWARERGYAVDYGLLRAAVRALRGGMSTAARLSALSGEQRLPAEKWQRLRVIGAAYGVDVLLEATDPETGLRTERTLRLLFDRNPKAEEVHGAIRAEIARRERRGTDPLFTGDDPAYSWALIEAYRRSAL